MAYPGAHHVGECLADADLRGIRVKACRPKSTSLGVGWDQDWGRRSQSTSRSGMSGQSTSTLHSGRGGLARGVE